jgi:hypothetical protein
MKIDELPIHNIGELKEENAYVIGNIVESEEDRITNINKTLIPVNKFASREEITNLFEQNVKLVEVINKLVQRLNIIEKTVSDIKELKSSDVEFDSIIESIKEINERLDKGIVEV